MWMIHFLLNLENMTIPVWNVPRQNTASFHFPLSALVELRGTKIIIIVSWAQAAISFTPLSSELFICNPRDWGHLIDNCWPCVCCAEIFSEFSWWYYGSCRWNFWIPFIMSLKILNCQTTEHIPERMSIYNRGEGYWCLYAEHCWCLFLNFLNIFFIWPALRISSPHSTARLCMFTVVITS